MPPRRAASQSQSRWLRDEGDATWEAKIGGETNSHNSRSDKDANEGKQISKRSNSRRLVVTESRPNNSNNQLAGFTTNSNLLYGLHEEENIGLQFEERERRRENPIAPGVKDIIMGSTSDGPQAIEQHLEADISDGDLAASTTSGTAKLALQASRLK